jgi:hypothetical protein
MKTQVPAGMLCQEECDIRSISEKFTTASGERTPS